MPSSPVRLRRSSSYESSPAGPAQDKSEVTDKDKKALQADSDVDALRIPTFRTLETSLASHLLDWSLPPLSPRSSRHSHYPSEFSLSSSFRKPSYRDRLASIVSTSSAGSDSTLVDSAPAPAPSRSNPDPAEEYIVDFCPGETANPRNWSTRYRWFLTSYLAFNSLVGPFCSSSYVGGLDSLQAHFGGSFVVTTLGVTLYAVGQGLGSLLWAPLSELHGRRMTYLLSFPLFIIFNLIGALVPSHSHTLWLVLLARFITGFFGSSASSNSGAQMTDLWHPREMVIPSALTALTPMLGPVLAPVVCNWVGEKAGWRAIFFVQCGYGALGYITWLLVVPETYAPVLLQRKTRRLHAWAVAVTPNAPLPGKEGPCPSRTRWISKYAQVASTPGQVIRRGMTKPLVLLVREPLVLLCSLYVALIFGIIYLLFTSYPIIFHQQHGWSLGLSGLPLLGIGVGMLLGLALSTLSSRLYRRAEAQVESALPSRTPSLLVVAPSTLVLPTKSETGTRARPHLAPLSDLTVLPVPVPVAPEVRLPLLCFGALLGPLSLFIFAWTAPASLSSYAGTPVPAHYIPVAIPIVFSVPVGIGFYLQFSHTLLYLAESYALLSASAVAGTVLVRSLVSGCFPLFAKKAFEVLGTGWTLSIPAFAAVACAPLPFLLMRFGPHLRSRSRYIPQGVAEPNPADLQTGVVASPVRTAPPFPLPRPPPFPLAADYSWPKRTSSLPAAAALGSTNSLESVSPHVSAPAGTS